jgi:adenylate cyclase
MSLKKTLFRPLAVYLLVLAAVAAIHQTGWLAGAEDFFHDLCHRLAGEREKPQHVVIVAVDDDTLEAHPYEPLVCWTPYWARVVQVLRQVGAGAIGLDYLFPVSIGSWLRQVGIPAGEAIQNFDQPFKDQLASGQVVLAGRFGYVSTGGREKKKITLPVHEFTASLPRVPAGVGLVNLATDADGAIRRYLLALEDEFDTVLLTFPYLLTLHLKQEDPLAEIQRLRADPRLKAWSADDDVAVSEAILPRIAYLGPPGTFPRLSFQRLLQPGAEKDEELRRLLRGKVVIIANEHRTSQDVHLTPYAQGFWWWPGQDMSGAEIHANIVENLLSGRRLATLSPGLQFLVLALFLGVAIPLYFRGSSLQGVGVLVLLLGLAAGLTYGLFLQLRLLPAAPLGLGLVLGYVGVLGLRLTGEERERARLRHIFGRYVSNEVVEKLLAEGARPDLGGESCRITVLFSDIRNFTSMSEKLSPAEVVELLNTYFTQACEPILQMEGTVDKFVGDAIMAIFGAPAAYPDHARRAIQAALGLAAVARDFQSWMTRRFPGLELPPFKIGVGIHTGEAVVGSIGSPKRLDYTAIGDTVNTASRLEGLSKDLGWTIVASRVTLEAAGFGVLVGDRRTVSVKGRQETVEVAEVLGIAVGD